MASIVHGALTSGWVPIGLLSPGLYPSRCCVPLWLWAGFWGLLAGSALLLGAAIGYLASVPQRLTAAIMAFGGGVLISALSFDLMDEAFQRGGFDSTAIGFVSGAAIYTV